MRIADVSELASRLRNLARPGPKEPRWLVVADVNVYIRAIAGHPEGPNRRIVEAAAMGVIVLVASEQIRREVVDVLCRPEIAGGYEEDQASSLVDEVCGHARLVTPGADDPQYRKVVRDPDDVIVLRTAAGIFVEEDLAKMTRLAIVSADKKAFPRDRNWFGFRYFDADEFWRVLEDG